MSNIISPGVYASSRYLVECYGPDGRLKWREGFENTVTTLGLNYLLDVGFKDATKIASWFVGLAGHSTVISDPGSTFALGDTMASHAGWAEVSTDYSQGTRPALTLGAISGGSVDNSASKAVFSITDDAALDGAFVTDNSTKGGTSGTLYGGGTFTWRSVANGDTVNVQITLTVANP